LRQRKTISLCKISSALIIIFLEKFGVWMLFGEGIGYWMGMWGVGVGVLGFQEMF
jgi:hypothetical protein